MEILDSLFLGVIQGLTEFLPISSSGHLILARDFLGIESSGGLAFDAVLQLATAFAVLLYFRHDFLRLFRTAVRWIVGREAERDDRMLLCALIWGTLPAGVAGILLESKMETVFRSSYLVAWMLLAGSVLFLVAEWFAKKYATVPAKPITFSRGLLIGFFQILALIPGMSRSGSTISGGLFAGLSREQAARFSFLLSFPLIFGSGIKKLCEILASGEVMTQVVPLLAGSLLAFVVGLGAIHFLLVFLRSHSLNLFVFYRVLLAITVFALLL